MEKKCKNCGKILPEGYKYKYCENCRNEHAHTFKKVGKGVLSVAGIIGGTVIMIATNGKIKPGDKS